MLPEINATNRRPILQAVASKESWVMVDFYTEKQITKEMILFSMGGDEGEMEITKITVEKVRFETGVRNTVIILWTEDGKPHTLVDSDHNVAYPAQLAENEQFEIIAEKADGN